VARARRGGGGPEDEIKARGMRDRIKVHWTNARGDGYQIDGLWPFESYSREVGPGVVLAVAVHRTEPWSGGFGLALWPELMRMEGLGRETGSGVECEAPSTGETGINAPGKRRDLTRTTKVHTATNSNQPLTGQG
jgi:hypothetical protein